MRTITQLQEDIKALGAKAASLETRATAENRDLTEEEIVYMNKLTDQIKQIRFELSARQERQKVQDELEKPEIPVTVLGNRNIATSQEHRDKFGCGGEFYFAVINAGRPGGIVDPRLRIQAAASGLGETVPSEGGFLVQQDIADRLSEDLFTNSLIASQCERIPISANSNSIALNGFDETSRSSSTYGGIVIYHGDEASEKTASKPKFRRVELTLKKMHGLCYLTDELMMDAAALETRVTSAFRKGFDFQIQDDLINGTGAGMALGILTAPCLVTVSKETGQKANTVMAENIIKMYSRRFASQTVNYAWYYNQNIEPQLFTMSLAVGTGGIPIYMPPGGLSGKPYATLMGLPAYAIEQCATLGTAGDIILANFKDGYIMAEKGGLKSDISIHVRFVYDESVLRFVLRMDGQPWRASALTPHKGGTDFTQSHFIVVATRA